jgi:hypothetical protein
MEQSAPDGFAASAAAEVAGAPARLSGDPGVCGATAPPDDPSAAPDAPSPETPPAPGGVSGADATVLSDASAAVPGSAPVPSDPASGRSEAACAAGSPV